MRDAVWAERIIGLFTDRRRAGAIVGDLLEGAEQQGTSPFWWSVAGIALSLAWRRPVAFITAFYLGLCSLGLVLQATHGIGAVHKSPAGWEPVFAGLGALTVLLAIAAPYAAIRYGFRDSFAQLALAFCCVVTISGFCWWNKTAALPCMVLACSIFVVAVASTRYRRALLALATSLVFGFAGGLLAFYLSALVYRQPVAQMSSGVVSFFWLLEVMILTTACSQMRRLLSWRDPMCRDAKLEGHDLSLPPSAS
ncbi:MAG: hypothetical protein WBP92_17660 [Candidatus Acidiferrales bacterium]